jgi:hypothetical protein
MAPALGLLNFLTPLFLIGPSSLGPDDPPDPGYRTEALPTASYSVTGTASPAPPLVSSVNWERLRNALAVFPDLRPNANR